MFDYENPFMEAAAAAEEEVNIPDGEWDAITDQHATQEELSGRAAARHDAERSREEFTGRFYAARRKHRKETTAIAAIRYAMLGVGLAVIAWLVRDYINLAITIGIAALLFGFVAAYGAGKCREM